MVLWGAGSAGTAVVGARMRSSSSGNGDFPRGLETTDDEASLARSTIGLQEDAPIWRLALKGMPLAKLLVHSAVGNFRVPGLNISSRS